MTDDHEHAVRAGDVIVEHLEHGAVHYTAHRSLRCGELRLFEHRARLKPVDLAPGNP